MSHVERGAEELVTCPGNTYKTSGSAGANSSFSAISPLVVFRHGRWKSWVSECRREGFFLEDLGLLLDDDALFLSANSFWLQSFDPDAL